MGATTRQTEAASINTARYRSQTSLCQDALNNALAESDLSILQKVYDGLEGSSDLDKHLPVDQAFREYLLHRLSDDVDRIGSLIKLSFDAANAAIISSTIPVTLLCDAFDVITLDKCELLFNYVEDHVRVLKKDIFFASSKNNLLRMCNDLLRRLSRTQNTVFCGRILLFLSKFFPLSERSGLNIVSEFNLENITEYGLDNKENKELDDCLEDHSLEIPIKIDYNLYCKFWSLQDCFRDPNQCYNKMQWKMFQAHATNILDAFASFKLSEAHPSTTLKALSAPEPVDRMDTDDGAEAAVPQPPSDLGYFPKFLTNPKLIALELSDSRFRRTIFVQFLIFLQYMQMPVKFKSDANTLTPEQTEFIKETETKVYKLLEETPNNGKRFARTVQNMLKREELWNEWKNEGCKEFQKPVPVATDPAEDAPPPAKRLKPFGDCLREAAQKGEFYLGSEALTNLWNHTPDNMQACKSEERNFLPQVDAYLDNAREAGDQSYQWRALRLLSRQTPHFFTFFTAPSCKIGEYLEAVRKRIAKEKEQSKLAAVGGVASADSTADIGVLAPTNSELGAVALQDNEADPVDVDDADEQTDDQNTHSKPVTATREQIEQLIAPLIGDSWEKLAKQLAFATDDIRYFREDFPQPIGSCVEMLSTWFTEDDDANLDNLAYILEGLHLDEAARAVQAMIEASRVNGTDKATKDGAD